MKQEILRVFKSAKQSHLEWLVHGARLMVEIDQNKSKKPMPHNQCAFSAWYESDGIHITKLPGLKRVEQHHKDFHQAYKCLYYKKFDRRASKKERKLFSRKFDTPTDSETTLKDKFKVLKLRYDVLDNEIQALEKIVSIMNRKLFEKDRIRL